MVKKQIPEALYGNKYGNKKRAKRHVLGREIGDLGELIRARKPKRLPVVMTREEVKIVPCGAHRR